MVDQLRPPGLRPPAAKVQDDPARAAGRNLHPAIWALLGFVAAMSLVVLVLLPALVENSPQETVKNASSRAAAVNQPQPLSAGVVRSDAEQALKDFLRLRAQPALAAAESWAAEDWQQAMDRALAGDGLYGEGRFSEALSAYKDAAQQLQKILHSRPERLAETLSAGSQALKQNEVDDAISAFQRVLAMQPDHTQAGIGLIRAQARTDVLKRMLDGSQAEAMNNLETANQAYQSALQLDASYMPAQAAADRTGELLIEQRFQQAMSAALQSLDQGRYKEAGAALQAAAAIHPQSAAVKDVQRRLAESRRRSGLLRLRRQAEQQAAREEWQAVAELSRKALAIDANAISARSGLAYAQQRLQLHRQLDHYLADSSRLSSDEPLNNARKLLLSNSNVPENEPQLKAKIARLQEAVRLAVIPVRLQIRSDGLTEVVIYHVGQLGRFEEKELTLRPGRYTLVGSCTGYRDVRKIITLTPKSGTQSIQMRCEELI